LRLGTSSEPTPSTGACRMPQPKSTTARNRVFVGNCCQMDAQRVASTASLTLSRHSCNLQRACRRVDYGEPMSQPPAAASPLNTRLYNLEYPRSLGVYSTYQEVQAVVDTLADNAFPVQRTMIVGTDLKLMERVTGRKTWGKVIGQGVLSGLWMGLFLVLLLMF